MLSETKKSRSYRLWPKLIIVEGFWRTGKSRLIRELTDRGRFSLINEPDHLTDAPDIEDPHQWYFDKHLERQSLARELIKGRRKVIMERSVLSSIAFDYAKQGKITKEDKEIIKDLLEPRQFLVVFLYAGKQFIKNAAQGLNDNFVKNNILKNKKFYSNYINFYEKILIEIIGNNVICLDIAPKGKILDHRKLVKRLETEIRQRNNKKNNRKKIGEICAATVLFYNDKILLLYDQNRNHYVLPQGHSEKGENLRQTAVREAREETGYSNLKLMKKIKRYQYHYLRSDKIIYKIIHVYLIRILSLVSVKKKFSRHESYTNHFFSFSEAIKQARWPQDKELIRLGRDYLKEQPEKFEFSGYNR